MGLVRAQAVGHLEHAVKAAFAREDPRAFLLPHAAVTAYHEAGHAVLHASIGSPVDEIRIWHERCGQGYVGACKPPPGAAKLDIKFDAPVPVFIERACIVMAGWCAEARFTPDRLKAGSSLDELVMADALLSVAGHKLGIEQRRMLDAGQIVTDAILATQEPVVRAIQKLLVQHRRVRGKKLTDLLGQVPRCPIADIVMRVATDGGRTDG